MQGLHSLKVFQAYILSKWKKCYFVPAFDFKVAEAFTGCLKMFCHSEAFPVEVATLNSGDA